MKHVCKKIMALLLVVAMIAGVLPSVFAAQVGPFTDVDDGIWYGESVQYVYDNGLMNGMTETTFEPETKLTRAQAVTVLYRIAKEPAVAGAASFPDLVGDWYKNAVAWAEEKGVVNGRPDGTFDPEGLITREELVTVIWRYNGSPKAEGDNLADWPDKAMVADYAKDSMNWAVENGVINGLDGKLAPQSNATRAQYAAIIMRFVEATKPCTEHAWDEGKVTKEATCTEAGEKVFTCQRCGETKTEEIPALGHNFVDGVCANGCGEKLAADDEIVIYYTNDVHTYINKALSYDSIADLYDQTKSVAAGALLVDAGDHIQGTAYGGMDNGKTIIELMNAAGYDLATLGNHEFDYGMERALGVVEQANFPYVSCNFYHEENGVKGDNVLDAYKIFTVGGKKIAVIGITTPESFTKSTPKYFQDDNGNYIYGIAGGEDGQALYAAVQAAIDAAKAESPDYIIALGHCGDDPASQPWTSEEVIANTTGLDAFIDGHSHSTVPMKEVKDKGGDVVVLTQTGSYFDAIGRMSITADGIKTELITEWDGSDADVAAIADAWMSEVDAKLGEKIAESDIDFTVNYDNGTRAVRSSETNLGDLNADAYYWYVNENLSGGCDMAIMNGGGIRANADSGDWTYKTCKTINTFGNVLCCIELTGQQILDALEFGARFTTGDPENRQENGGFLQVAGCTYAINTYTENTVTVDDKNVWQAGPTEYRVTDVKIYNKETKTYEPLDLTKTYRVAGTNYTLYDCGDGFNMFTGGKHILDGISEDYLAMAAYVQAFADTDNNNYSNIASANSPLAAYENYLLNYESATGSGRIVINTTEPEPAGDEYVLTSGLKDGDEVVIVCAAKNVALSATYDGYYNSAVAVTPVDGKIAGPAADIVWTVGKDGDNYTFSYNGQKLAMGDSFSSMPLGEKNDQWVLEDGTTAGTYFIKNVARQVYVEYYETNGNWSGYYNNSVAELFEMNFYVKSDGGEAPHVHTWDEGAVTTEATCTEPGVKTFTCECGETKTEEIPALGHVDVDEDGKCDRCGAELEVTEYVLASELKDGDKVVIVNVAQSKALNKEIVSTYYKAGTAVTPADGKIVSPDSAIVWTVKADGEGFNLENDEGKKLSIDGTYSSIPYDMGNDAWSVAAAATENCVYVVNENGKYLSWSSYGNFSAYTYDESKEADYAMQLYVLKTESAETGAYTIATEIVVGDKIVITAKYDGTYYAATNAINPSNAIAATAVTVADGQLTFDDNVEVVWEVVASESEGKYLLKNPQGNYMTYAGSGTGMKIDEVGYAYTLTCGEGTSTVDMGTIGTTHRLLIFRMSNNVPQFRAYAESNADGEYSRDITIWKIAG